MLKEYLKIENIFKVLQRKTEWCKAEMMQTKKYMWGHLAWTSWSSPANFIELVSEVQGWPYAWPVSMQPLDLGQ